MASSFSQNVTNLPLFYRIWIDEPEFLKTIFTTIGKIKRKYYCSRNVGQCTVDKLNFMLLLELLNYGSRNEAFQSIIYVKNPISNYVVKEDFDIRFVWIPSHKAAKNAANLNGPIKSHRFSISDVMRECKEEFYCQRVCRYF